MFCRMGRAGVRGASLEIRTLTPGVSFAPSRERRGLAGPPGCLARPTPLSEPNIIVVLSKWRIEPGTRGGGCLGIQEG